MSVLPLRGLLLNKAIQRIEQRVLELDKLLDAGDHDRASWEEYLGLVSALAQLVMTVQPEHGGPLLSTKEMASRLGITPKTLLRRRHRGELQATIQLAKRGRAAFRWSGQEVGR
jgi:hypothetical protein